MILFFISMELVTLIVVCLIRGSESANLRFVQGNNYYAGRGRGIGGNNLLLLDLTLSCKVSLSVYIRDIRED